MQVQNFVRRIFLPVAPEDEKPKYIHGEPVAGSKHYGIEERQQRDRGWLKACGAWERLNGR